VSTPSHMQDLLNDATVMMMTMTMVTSVMLFQASISVVSVCVCRVLLVSLDLPVESDPQAPL